MLSVSEGNGSRLDHRPSSCIDYTHVHEKSSNIASVPVGHRDHNLGLTKKMKPPKTAQNIFLQIIHSHCTFYY